MNDKNILIVKKSIARLMAIQILFQYDFYNQSKKIIDLKEELLDHYLIDTNQDLKSFRSKIDRKHLNNIILSIENIGYKEFSDITDDKINKFLEKDFTIDKMSKIILQILRIAIYEMKYLKNIPVKVIISEYTDIAASFENEKEVKFVNSILENIAKDIYPECFKI
jgi:N utilization substance protein B